MVRIKILVLFIIFLCSQAKAATFSSTLSHDKISINQTFHLTLKLSNSTATSDVDLTLLDQNFVILGQSVNSIVKITNHKTSRAREWRITLRAKSTGRYKIPTITLQTDQGSLTSEELFITVTKSNSPQADNIFVKTIIAPKTHIYQYQPLLYRVKLYTKNDLSELEFSKYNIPNAIVELHSSNQYHEQYKGVDFVVIDRRYIITPLQAMNLEIPSIEINVLYHTKSQNSTYPSLFSALIRNNLNAEQFTLKTKPTKISVLPSITDAKYWLPATSLSLTDAIDDGEFTVGDSITRVITVHAESIQGKQLPNDLVSDSMHSPEYKLYYNTPKTTDSIKDNKIITTKHYTCTIVPTKSGDIKLPKISIKWWNTNTGQYEISTLQTKNIKVKEGYASKKIDSNISLPLKSNNSAASITTNDQPQDNELKNYIDILYVIIICLIGLLCIVTIFVIFQKKRSLINHDIKSRYSISHKPKIKDVQSLTSIKAIYKFLQQYSSIVFNTSSNLSVSDLFQIFEKHIPAIKTLDYQEFLILLEDGLYRGKVIDINVAKQACKEFLILVNKKKSHKSPNIHNREESLKLNP